MREGKLTIVDSDKPYLWAEDAEDVVEVGLTPHIEGMLRRGGYEPRDAAGLTIWVGPGGVCRTIAAALEEIRGRKRQKGRG